MPHPLQPAGHEPPQERLPLPDGTVPARQLEGHGLNRLFQASPLVAQPIGLDTDSAFAPPRRPCMSSFPEVRPRKQERTHSGKAARSASSAASSRRLAGRGRPHRALSTRAQKPPPRRAKAHPRHASGTMPTIGPLPPARRRCLLQSGPLRLRMAFGFGANRLLALYLLRQTFPAAHRSAPAHRARSKASTVASSASEGRPSGTIPRSRCTACTAANRLSAAAEAAPPWL